MSGPSPKTSTNAGAVSEVSLTSSPSITLISDPVGRDDGLVPKCMFSRCQRRHQLPRTEVCAPGYKSTDIKPCQRVPQLNRSCDDKRFHLVDGLGRALIAESLTILSIRIISTLSRPDIG